MEKAIGVIEDWLQECSEGEEIEHLYSSIENIRESLITSIFTIFDEKARCSELFDAVLRQLVSLVRSKDEKLREFVLYFAPILIQFYMTGISMGDKKSVLNIEVTLLALYNMELLDEEGKPRLASFRIPSLARESIYHDPASLSPASYTTESLHRLESVDQDTVRWGPPHQMFSVTAAARNHLATAILVAFNARLERIPELVLLYFCKASSKIVCQGFTRPGHHQRASYGSDSSFGVYPRPIPRISVNSDMLSELLYAVYFAIHNISSKICPSHMKSCSESCYHSPKVQLSRRSEYANLALQALDDIHMRAQYELFPDVLLMSNSIKHSLRFSSSQKNDGSASISFSLTPLSSISSLSKSCITNASFRTKKLPEDIPIQRLETGQEGSSKGLVSITEEGENEDKEKDSSKFARPSLGSGREKIKLPSNHPLTNFVKKRDKEKIRNGDKKNIEKKEKKPKQDKENKNDSGLNRNSTTANSDSDGGGTVSLPDSAGVLQSPQTFNSDLPNQVVELMPLLKLTPILDVPSIVGEDSSDSARNSLDMNESQNHVAKLL